MFIYVLCYLLPSDCERGFSKLKLLKTRLRSRLVSQTLNALMMASIEGPPVESFPFVSAGKIWASIRNRKISLNFSKLDQDVPFEALPEESDEEDYFELVE